MLGNAFAIQYVSELAQNIQVLIVLGSDGDEYMHLLAVVPLDPVWKLQHAYARLLHILTAFWRTVGDRNGVA